MSAELKVKGFIFDLDGTLLDTLEDLRDACNHIMRAYGHAEHDLEATRYLVGEGLRRMLGRASGIAPTPEDLQKPGLKEKVEAMYADMSDYYGRNWAVKSRPYAGITELISRLAKDGTPMAVLSNKTHKFTLEIVEHFFPDCQFVDVVGMKDGVPAKPHPDGALAIAERMGIAPGQLGFVGDTSIDMRTATGAGMQPFGVTWGFRTKDELLAHGAKALIDKPEELLGYI